MQKGGIYHRDGISWTQFKQRKYYYQYIGSSSVHLYFTNLAFNVSLPNCELQAGEVAEWPSISSHKEGLGFGCLIPNK